MSLLEQAPTVLRPGTAALHPKALFLVPVAFLALSSTCALATYSPVLQPLLARFGHPEPDVLRAIFLLSTVFLAAQSALTMNLRAGSWSALVVQTILSGLLVAAAAAVIELGRAVLLSLPATFTEGIILLSAIAPRDISHVYAMQNLTRPPFLISIYGPAYYLLLKAGISLLGPSVAAGRVAAFAGIISAMWALFSLAPKDQSWTSRLLSPLLFLFALDNFVWGGSLGKPDYIGAAFSLLGVVSYMTFRRKPAARWLVLAATLSGMGVLIKVSLLAGYLAVAFDMLWTRRYRQAACYIAGVPGVVLAAYAFLWKSTGGGLWTMTITANALRLSYFWAALNLRSLLSPAGALFIVLAAIGSIYLLPRNRQAESNIVPSVYFFIAFGWYLLAIARPGSSSSYVTETAIASSWVISLAIARPRGTQPRLLMVWSGWLLAILAIAIPPQIVRASQRYHLLGNKDRIAGVLASSPLTPGQYVMTDVYYVLDVDESGHQPLINDSAQFTSSVDSGRLSAVPMLEAFKQRSVPYALLFNSPDWHLQRTYGLRYWPTSVMAFVKENYECNDLGQTEIFLNQSRRPLQGELTFCRLKPLR